MIVPAFLIFIRAILAPLPPVTATPSELPCGSVEFQYKSFFCGKGVLFSGEHLQKMNWQSNFKDDSLMAVSKQDAVAADSIFLANTRSGIFKKNINRYYHFDRQYFGFIDWKGEKFVFIHLIERRKARRYISDYESSLRCVFISVLTEPGMEFTASYKVNLSTASVKPY